MTSFSHDLKSLTGSDFSFFHLIKIYSNYETLLIKTAAFTEKDFNQATDFYNICIVYCSFFFPLVRLRHS